MKKAQCLGLDSQILKSARLAMMVIMRAPKTKKEKMRGSGAIMGFVVTIAEIFRTTTVKVKAIQTMPSISHYSDLHFVFLDCSLSSYLHQIFL